MLYNCCVLFCYTINTELFFFKCLVVLAAWNVSPVYIFFCDGFVWRFLRFKASCLIRKWIFPHFLAFSYKLGSVQWTHLMLNLLLPQCSAHYIPSALLNKSEKQLWILSSCHCRALDSPIIFNACVCTGSLKLIVSNCGIDIIWTSVFNQSMVVLLNKTAEA